MVERIELDRSGMIQDPHGLHRTHWWVGTGKWEGKESRMLTRLCFEQQVGVMPFMEMRKPEEEGQVFPVLVLPSSR